MKETQDYQDNQVDNEFEHLIFDELNEIENKKNKKEINLCIYNYTQKKMENYKLLNEEEEILLCKEEAFNEIKSKRENNEEIKIKELYKGEDNDSFYYINKKELKKKYLMITDLNEDNENVHEIIDNKDDNEMEKLYEEIQLKHPRKIIDGKITRYPFFSWSGFFCCNKPEYMSLGEAYITYFNTIKLLIIFFLIIALINSHLIRLCRSFSSIYKFSDDNNFLLSTTLGNTITRSFNTSSHNFNFRGNFDSYYIFIDLDCGENIIGEFVAIQRCYGVHDNLYIYEMQNEFKEYYKTECKTYSGEKFIDAIYELNYFLNRSGCNNNSTFTLKFYTWYYNIYEPFYYESHYDSYYFELYENLTDIYYYSCKKANNKNIEDKEKELQTSIMVISILTLIIIILFYSLYKKAISRSKKEFERNKIFINNYTLVLHNLKINSNDFNHELNDLISFLNNIIQKYKHLFISYHENYKEITDLNVFDISISNVNGKKLESFNKIKSLQNKLEDVLNDKDSIKNKVKSNIREIYRSMHNIAVNLSDQEQEETKIVEDNNSEEKIEETEQQDEGYNLDKQIKIGKIKTEINI